MKHSIRFYAASLPLQIDYPYILSNLNQNMKYETTILHEIIDCGINDLLKAPYSHSQKKLRKWQRIKTKKWPIWKVIPDCPDMIKEFQLKIEKKKPIFNNIFNNIAYSKQLLQEYYNPADLTHLPVIQSRFMDVESARNYAIWFLKNYDPPPQIGIGSACKANNKVGITQIVQIIRKKFPKSWIHAFGLKLNHLEAVFPYINSYDSASWSFPRGHGRAALPWAAMRTFEANSYFQEYIEAIPPKILKFTNHNKLENFFPKTK